MGRKIAFQGELGAFSHATAVAVFPDDEPLPCVTFEETIGAVQSGAAEYAVVPVENSLYGRIADIHHILPESGLYIIGEYYLPVRMNLLAVPGDALRYQGCQSLSVALGQCRTSSEAQSAHDQRGRHRRLGREIAQKGDRSVAAIASRFAADIYGLDVLAENIEDAAHNTTRFLIMSREPQTPKSNGQKVKTTFVFRVHNVPAALYKAMGGFATNGVNMTKLESYMVGGSFTATQFYADIEGHPDDQNVKYALEELGFFSDHIKLLGVYPIADSAP